MAIHALCRQEIFRVYAPMAGICRARLNGKLCSTQLVAHQPQGQSSSLHLDGITVAMARMLSGSRRFLLATGVTMEFTVARAMTRSSGVLRSTVTVARTTCTCSTAATMCTCATRVVSASGTLSVVSRTKPPLCFSNGRSSSAKCWQTSGRIRRRPCQAKGRGAQAQRQMQG